MFTTFSHHMSNIICAIVIGLGLWAAGCSIGKGMYLIKSMNRTLTVKGLAEHDVVSDLGIWEINFKEVGNNLIAINTRLQHDQSVITNFLKQQGFADSEISAIPFKVEDKLANVYSQNNTPNPNDQRYVVTGGIRVRSNRVYLIQKTVAMVNQLLQQDVPLAFDSGNMNPNPSFYYTRLDDIRPKMMSEATKSAYLIAQQFEKDSYTSLAGIQRASQGVFQIMGRDTSTLSADWNSNQNALGSVEKKVRLVTTIDFRLK